MSSARSVSHALMPASSSASLSSISWVAIDLTLTTSSTSLARTMSTTIRLASSASRAQCTTAPAAVSGGLELLEVVAQVVQRLVLGLGAGQPQRLPLGHLGHDVGALGADRVGGVVRGCAAAGCWPAPRVPPRGTSASRRRSPRSLTVPRSPAVRVVLPYAASPGRRWRRRAHAGCSFVEARISARCMRRIPERCAPEDAADVGQAGVVAGDEHLGAGLDDVPRPCRRPSRPTRRRSSSRTCRRSRSTPRRRAARRGRCRARPAAAGAGGRRPAACAASGRSGGR